MKGSSPNLCANSCRVLNYRTCPMFDHAVKKGLKGMSKCEIYDAIEMLVKDLRDKRK